MKTYRPLSAGFIVLYTLTALTVADSIAILVRGGGGGAAIVGSFGTLAHVITVIALIYTYMYVRAKTVIGEETLRVVFPAYVNPPKEGRRAPFLYRQGDLDLHLVDKTITYKDVEKWGYIEDLGVSRLDKSRADEKSPLLGVHEIAFITKDGKRYHMNAKYYTKRQLAAMLPEIAAKLPVRATGKLGE